MSTRPAVILSPHLDDAVLSCWHLLCGPRELRVINVFAGSPAPGSGTSWWDRTTGAADSVARMAERRDEDREAFSIAGRSALNLDFLDDQYDPADQSVGAIVAQLGDLIDPGTEIYAPAALGDHADHDQVRSAGLALAAAGRRVHLYADHPHAVRRGWPDWIDGADPDAGRAVAADWERRLAGVDLVRRLPDTHRLTPDEQQHKLRAVSAYRTQIRALKESFGALEGFPALPYEFTWTVT